MQFSNSAMALGPWDYGLRVSARVLSREMVMLELAIFHPEYRVDNADI